MKICLSLFVLMLIGAASCSPAEPKSVQSVPLSSTTKYRLITTFEADWNKALHHCLVNDMKLASISSNEENNQIHDLIRDAGFNQDCWIGGRRINNETFYWMGHYKQLTFTDWINGEPNNEHDDEGCLELYYDYGFKWNDDNCNKKQAFICEVDTPNEMKN